MFSRDLGKGERGGKGSEGREGLCVEKRQRGRSRQEKTQTVVLTNRAKTRLAATLTPKAGARHREEESRAAPRTVYATGGSNRNEEKRS